MYPPKRTIILGQQIFLWKTFLALQPTKQTIVLLIVYSEKLFNGKFCSSLITIKKSEDEKTGHVQ